MAKKKTGTKKKGAKKTGTKRKGAARKKGTTPADVNKFTLQNLGVKMYKVIQSNGTGGHTSMNWTPHFPTATGPGKPATVPTNRPLSPCAYGLHVTKTPHSWGADSYGARVFEAEVYGPYKTDDGSKICAYKIVLTKEVFRPKPIDSPFDSNHQRNVPIKRYAGK